MGFFGREGSRGANGGIKQGTYAGKLRGQVTSAPCKEAKGNSPTTPNDAKQHQCSGLIVLMTWVSEARPHTVHVETGPAHWTQVSLQKWPEQEAEAGAGVELGVGENAVFLEGEGNSRIKKRREQVCRREELIRC